MRPVWLQCPPRQWPPHLSDVLGELTPHPQGCWALLWGKGKKSQVLLLK